MLYPVVGDRNSFHLGVTSPELDSTRIRITFTGAGHLVLEYCSRLLSIIIIYRQLVPKDGNLFGIPQVDSW